jgi:hypothetical protein
MMRFMLGEEMRGIVARFEDSIILAVLRPDMWNQLPLGRRGIQHAMRVEKKILRSKHFFLKSASTFSPSRRSCVVCS